MGPISGRERQDPTSPTLVRLTRYIGDVAGLAVPIVGGWIQRRDSLSVSLLSTVHAPTSGLTTGWMPVVKPDEPRPPATGRRWPASRALHSQAER